MAGLRGYGNGNFFGKSVRHDKLELSHIPRGGWATLGAQSAVQAHVLVLHHHALGLRQRTGDINVLRHVQRRRHETGAKIVFRAVLCDGQAIGGADINAGVALDAEIVGEVRLDVAVEAALHLRGGLLRGEAEFDFGVHTLEALHQRLVSHLLAR